MNNQSNSNNTDNIINTINSISDIKSAGNFEPNLSHIVHEESFNKDRDINLVNHPSQEKFISYGNTPYNQQHNIGDSDLSQNENLVLNYASTNTLYSIAFQNTDICRLALGTLEKNMSNRIEIVEMENENLTLIKAEPHEFPCTKLMWNPSQNANNTLAASSDVVRLYKYSEEDRKLNLSLTLNNKKSKYCSPLTSFDWNKENNSILGTASIDTTCTIWDLNKNTIRTQLIAHDKEVFDIAFSQNEHVFISTGADGSIRLFDLRSLDHSTIIYETKDQTPITKIAWNMQNSSFISALAWEKDIVYIIDSRVAMVSLVELKSHSAPVTAMSWAPQSHSHICSVGEDKFVLIWNIQTQLDNTNSGPILSYKAPHEIYNVSWCNLHPEWIGITFKNQVQLLRV
jgi:WD repeat-containing protein 68